MNKFDMYRRLKITLAFTLAFLTLTSAVGLMISGAIIKADVKPGEHVSHIINISIGENEQAADFEVVLVDFVQDLNGGISVDESIIGPYSAKPFLSTSPNTIHLEPGESQEIIVEGDIPGDVGSGGRYAVVAINGIAPSVEENIGTVAGSIVPVIFTILDTELIRTGEITDIKMEEYSPGEPLNIEMELKNTGNYYYQAVGKAKLKDVDGNSIADAESKLGEAIIPPHSRLLKIQLKPENDLEPGSYTVDCWAELKDGTTLASQEIQIEV